MSYFVNRIMRLGARGFAALPDGVHRAIAGTPVEVDGQRLHPQVQSMLRLFGDPPGKIETVAQTRAGFDAQGDWLAHAPAPGVTVQSLDLGGVPCRRFTGPDCPGSGAPVLVLYHGGGHAAGSLDSHSPVARQLAAQLPAQVILVAHRLAPDHKFPAGIDDCLAVFDALVGGAAGEGIDPARITVAGDSAGGNAAAVVAQQRRGAVHPPRFQMLWSPWLDMSRQHPSYDLFAEGFFLEKSKMEWYTDHYLAQPADADDPRASPLLGDVAGVCSAAVMVAGFDPLRDEGLAYGAALTAAGVRCDTILLEGIVHPWINMAGSMRGPRAAFDRAVAILRAEM